MSFTVGDVATLEYTLTVDRVATSATVTLTVTSPAGVVTTPAVVEDPVGAYTADVPALQHGTWAYLWTATGEATDAESGTFYVQPPASAGDGDEPLAPWVDVATLQAIPALSDLPEDALQLAATTATEVLFVLSGQRWPGVRPVTLHVTGRVDGGHVPLPVAAPWGAFTGRTGCGCHSTDLDPQAGRIQQVLTVTVGDVTIPLDQVQVVDGFRLRVRRGDSTTDPLAVNRWPTVDGYYSLWPGGTVTCGRPAAAVVELEAGEPPPAGGLLAARVLATEFAKALADSDDCQLPGNAVSVNRQGVSVLLDPTEIYKQRRVGLPAVDAWLVAVNPNHLQAAPTVWWPEQSTVERLS